MRIKFKDKIYRLKEIESGVDSLMELVEEPKHKYKEGDFLTTVSGSCFILKNICGSKVYDHAFLGENWIDWDNGHCCYLDDITGYCTPEERSKVIAAIKKAGKRWNAEKKCIEDIHVYKDGDFVVNELDAILIFKEADGDRISDHVYLPVYGELVIDKVVSCKGIKRHATTEEKQRMIEALAKEGKRWNEDKKCIENVTVYKKGDILVKEYTENKKFIFILSRIDEDGLMYIECYHSTLLNKTEVVYNFVVGNIWNKKLRHAVESEKKLLITELSKIGKRWNADKKCIENILQRKFKTGDKVRIKDGISSKTHRRTAPSFVDAMDKFIGKELTVKEYSSLGWVVLHEDVYGYQFSEDWLEPCSEEPKVGDWVIFWDFSPKLAKVGILTDIRSDSLYKYRIDEGVHWMHVVKWDGTKEHLEEVRKDKI